MIEENPQYLNKNNFALVVMVPSRPLCVEAFAEYPKLGRFVVSDLGKKIIAVGKIRKVLKNENS